MSEATLGRANVQIGTDQGELDQGLSEAQQKVKSALEGVAKAAATAIGVGLGLVAAGLGLAVKEAMGAQEALLQLDIALNALGTNAAVGKDALLGYASALQETTRFSDEAVMAAEAILLRFTSIGTEAFPQVLDASADLATGLGIDLSQAAQMLGRAMEDPDLAARSLRQANIMLSDAEVEQLKAMKAVGDAAGVQALILGKVAGAYGGAAEAAGQTFGGQLDILKNRFSDILEQIGGAVLPIIQQLADKLLTWLADPAIQAGIDNFVAGLATWVSYIAEQVLPRIFEVGAAIIDGLGQAVSWLSGNQGVIVGILGIIAAAFLVWGYNAAAAGIATLTALAPILIPIAAIGAAVAVLYAAWTQNWGGIQQVVMNFWAQIQPALQTIWTGIMTVFTAVQTFLQENWTQIQAIFMSAWLAIQGIIQVALAIIQGIIQTVAALISGDWAAAWEAIKTMFEGIWNGIVLFLSGIGATLWGVMDLALKAFGTNLSTALAGIKLFFTTAWDDIVAWFRGIPQAFADIGNQIVAGLLGGIQAAWQSVVDWIEQAVADLGDAAKLVLGIQSPSALFADIGRNVSLGMAAGIAAVPIPPPCPARKAVAKRI